MALAQSQLIPIHLLLNRALNNTHYRFISYILFETYILYSTIH